MLNDLTRSTGQSTLQSDIAAGRRPGQSATDAVPLRSPRGSGQTQFTRQDGAAAALTAEYGIGVPPDAESLLLWGDTPAPATLDALYTTLARKFDHKRATIDPNDIRSPSRVAYGFMIEQAKAYYRRKYEDPTTWTSSQLIHKSKDYIVILWSRHETGRAAMQAIAAGLPGATQGKMLPAAEDACRALVFEQLSPNLDALLRAAVAHILLKGVSPLFALHLEFEARDPLLDSIGFTSDEHVLLCLGQAAGKRRGQTLTPDASLTLGLAEVNAIHDAGTAQEKAILILNQALLWARFNHALNAERLTAWGGGAVAAQLGMEQLLLRYRDRHGVPAEWEKALGEIVETLRTLPTLTSAYDDLLKKYGYTHKSLINVKASYHWSAKLHAAVQANACNSAAQLCQPVPPFTPYFWGRFEESLLQRAGDFTAIEFKPAATSPHAGDGMVKLTPEDLKHELKRQLDRIQSTLENKAGEMLLLMLKPALTKQAELRRQAWGNQAPDAPLEMAYVRLESLYRVSAKLDHDSQRPGLPSEALQWPRQARDAQPNAMILKIHTGREAQLWVVRFEPETGALLYLKSLQLPATASAARVDMIPSEMARYVQAHPIEFFEEVPNPGRAGLMVRYEVHEVAVARTPEMPTGEDVQTLEALRGYFGPGRLTRDERIPPDLRRLDERMAQWGLGQDETRPQLKEAVAVIHDLHRRLTDADPAYSTRDALWRPILSMTAAERLKIQNALRVLGAEFKRRIPAEQALYFHALAGSTGIGEKIARLLADAERFVHKPSVGEFLVDQLPFVSGSKHIAAIHNDYVTTAIDQHTLLVGGPRPHQKSGGHALFQDQDLAVGVGMGMELLALMPVLAAVGHTLRMAKLTLLVSSRLAAIAYFQQHSVVQIARQVLTHPLMHAAAGALRKAAVQLAVQGVDLISPIPGTDTMLNAVLNKLSRGLRISAQLGRGVNALLQSADPVLLKRLADMPAIEAPSVSPNVLPTQFDVDAHFKIGAHGDWQLSVDNPPAVEIRNGLRYLKDSEVAIATVGGHDVAVKKVGTNGLGEDYFKRLDLQTGELEGGPLRLLPPIGSAASETARVEIVQYRRLDGTVEATQSTLNWDQVNQVADGDETLLMVRPHDSHYVVETRGETAGLRLALEDEVAAFVACFNGLSRIKRAPKKLPCKRGRASARFADAPSSEDTLSAPESSVVDHAGPESSAVDQILVGAVKEWHDIASRGRQYEEAGSMPAFALEHKVNLYTLRSKINYDGILSRSGRELLGLPPGIPDRKATAQDVALFGRLRQAGQKISRTYFAQQHGISKISLYRLVEVDGTPKLHGRKLLANQVILPQRPPSEATFKAVQKLLRLEEKPANLTTFASENDISQGTLSHYIFGNGELTPDGLKWFKPDGSLTEWGKVGIKQVPHQYRAIERRHIDAWGKLARTRNMSIEEFAKRNDIHYSSLLYYIDRKGVRNEKRIEGLIDKDTKIVAQVLQKMASGPAPDPNRVPGERVSVLRTVKEGVTLPYVDEHGLTRRGQMVFEPDGRLKTPPPEEDFAPRYLPTSAENIREWLEMPADRHNAQSMLHFAAGNQLDIVEFSRYVLPNGIVATSQGFDLLLPPAPQRAAADAAAGSLGAAHRIDNNAPLIPVPGQAGLSVLKESMDLDKLTDADWGDALRRSFADLPESQRDATKRGLLQTFSNWLKAEGDLDAKFNSLVRPAGPHDGPGTSLHAVGEMDAYTVLGPYRGELVAGDEQFNEVFKRHARGHVLSYHFNTGPGKTEVDATVQGNVLSLMQTGKLPYGDPLPRVKDKLNPNNVALVRLDEGVDFYVTKRPIAAGEELLVDYGSVHDSTLGIRLPEADADRVGDALFDNWEAFIRAQTDIRTPQRWDDRYGDLVATLSGRAGLIEGRGVALVQDADLSVNPRNPDTRLGHAPDERVFQPMPPLAQGPALIEIYHDGAYHYSATRRLPDGSLQILDTDGDGDSFYRALYASGTAVLPDYVPFDRIVAVRNRLADYLSDRYLTYIHYLDSSPTQSNWIYRGANRADIIEWISMTPGQRAELGMEQFAAARKVDIYDLSWYVTRDGVVKVSGLKLLSREGADGLVPDIVAVKPDPEIPRARIHSIDNNRPILASFDDPSVSVTRQHVDPENIVVTGWGTIFDGLPPRQVRQIKLRLKQEFAEWIRAEFDLDRKFTALMEVGTPVDEVDRGMSVFALADLEPFTVLGPFSGVLVMNDAQLNKAFQLRGREQVLMYLFGTRSQHRTIDASVHGNILSLMNTGQLKGMPPLPGVDPQAPNNVVVVRVGNNLPFYVTTRAVKKGDELLVDYGPEYDTALWQNMDEPKTKRIKIESSEMVETSDTGVTDTGSGVRRDVFAEAVTTFRTMDQWNNDYGDLFAVMAGRAGINGRGLAVIQDIDLIPHSVNPPSYLGYALPIRTYHPVPEPAQLRQPIEIYYDGIGHYSATHRSVNGVLTILPTYADNNCFFRAVLASANPAVSPADFTLDDIRALRSRLAIYLREHPGDVFDFLPEPPADGQGGSARVLTTI